MFQVPYDSPSPAAALCLREEWRGGGRVEEESVICVKGYTRSVDGRKKGDGDGEAED